MSYCRVTLPRSVLLATLSELIASNGERLAWGMAGKASRREGDEFVIPKLNIGKPDLKLDGLHPNATLFLLKISPTLASVENGWALNLLALVGISDDRPVGTVTVSSDGSASGWVRNETRWVPVTEFSWPGAEMHNIRQTEKLQVVEPIHQNDRHSRLIGAIGSLPYERLRGLRFAVIGVSGTGSLIAHSLARMGVQRISLIDPDVVEPHNANAAEFHPSLDEGLNKATAIARQIRRIQEPGGTVEDFGQALLCNLPFSAARDADVIVTSVDDDGARLVAALLASSYLRVHLDIGTQVLRDPATGKVTAGADVRLILPDAHARCLACFGGFAQPDDLRRMAGFDTSEMPNWRTRRSGTLRSVNQVAAHMGLRLIERLVTGDLTQSSWLRYEESPSPTIREIVPRPQSTCPLCGSTSGIGDEAFENRDLRLRRLVRALVGAAEKASVAPKEGLP